MGLEWLDADDIVRREPEVNPEVQGGVYSPYEGNIRGQRLVDSLVNAASRLGAEFRQGVEVTGLRTEGRRVTGVETTAGPINAGQVVLAAGPWTGIGGRWLGLDASLKIPVRPVKGERVLLRKPGFSLRCAVRNFEAYLVPQVDGDISVAATRVEGRFDEQVTAGGIANMISEAARTFPILADAEFVSARAGVRPATPDDIPVLGPVPEYEGLSVAAGHDAVGIMLSPGTAELMCQYILDGNTAPLEPFSISRFT
jgi:glycine oxidase